MGKQSPVYFPTQKAYDLVDGLESEKERKREQDRLDLILLGVSLDR